MRRIVIGSIAALMLATLIAGIATRRASAEPKGKTVTVSGELVDMWCYYEDGSKGADHKACATQCAKAGNPICILQKNGQVYVLVGMEDHQPAKDVLADKMGDSVTLKGTLVSKGGVNVLFVSGVSSG